MLEQLGNLLQACVSSAALAAVGTSVDDQRRSGGVQAPLCPPQAVAAAIQSLATGVSSLHSLLVLHLPNRDAGLVMHCDYD